jgi:K+-sensing histidine kinase KdpD
MSHWKDSAIAAGLVALATAISAAGRALFALPDVVMLYLLAIMVVAIRFGRGASVLSALLSVASYDFFFIPPYYTFTVEDGRHTLTFMMMVVVGLVISGLTTQVRRRSKEAEQQALRARTEELRSSLLSTVSHDLRTPLGAITGATTLLLDESSHVPAPQRKELLETIRDEAERLERLVTNLLDMTRLESGGLSLKRAWVPVEDVVGSVLTRSEKILEGRVVTTQVPTGLPLISVDPVLFEQVFLNLLENATKHTPLGAPIALEAWTNDREIVIQVSDGGPGLPGNAATRIFEKFYRGSNARGGGAGLGLAICKGIVEAHGGKITATNRAEGGASFRVSLPVTDAAPAVPSENEVV